MKKSLKKLQLSRETLRRLDERSLPPVFGGDSVACSFASECNCSYTDCSVVCLMNNGCTETCNC
jgi:hypothetical protein